MTLNEDFSLNYMTQYGIIIKLLSIRCFCGSASQPKEFRKHEKTAAYGGNV